MSLYIVPVAELSLSFISANLGSFVGSSLYAFIISAYAVV
nr:MAG TPA: hypothetical protein [Bacteriophage sp.]DAQ19754.1 MAG TPA: hypothetical protein [Caudoviricetes sp.]DAW88274.1 MAG TPA: hypothetical protein [Caudoviricetes sp.]